MRFFLQLVAILCACRLVSALAKRLGQPPVVGEMIAGVLLGPSLFGLLAPGAQAWLFPEASKPILFAGAQVGLALYMFTVGLEFRVELVRARLKSALAISASGILAPFALGCLVAVWLWREGGFFGEAISLKLAAPYMGAAMAITAFPMLARIIFERKLTGTPAGVLALAAGAIDDAAAWGVLALVLAGLKGEPKLALYAIGGGALFVVLLRYVARPYLKKISVLAETSEDSSRSMTGWVLVLLMIAAWYTDVIGLYAVFGAFFLGATFPKGKFSEHLIKTIEPLTTMLLLPLFFTYSGLNTRFDLITMAVVLPALVCLAAAVLGKAGACYLAARACGEPNRDALGIGMLMNARGLMELIILNIGLQAKIITPALFTILVFMAIVTTLMATPLYNLTVAKPPRPTA